MQIKYNVNIQLNDKDVMPKSMHLNSGAFKKINRSASKCQQKHIPIFKEIEYEKKLNMHTHFY